jgi:hypothetical protein
MRTYDETEGLLAHPYWDDVLSLPSEGINPYIKTVANFNKLQKAKFLELIVRGFYPLTGISYYVFKQIELTSKSAVEDIVKPIYEAELGLTPLVKGTKYDLVAHPEQFRQLIESLEDGISIRHPIEDAHNFSSKINIKNASLSQAFSYASAIENSGPYIIYALEEFVAQWQVLCGRKSKHIKLNFILEHGLIEGSESEDQHITMMKELAHMLDGQINEDEAKRAAQFIVKTYHAHLDSIYAQISELTGIELCQAS